MALNLRNLSGTVNNNNTKERGNLSARINTTLVYLQSIYEKLDGNLSEEPTQNDKTLSGLVMPVGNPFEYYDDESKTVASALKQIEIKTAYLAERLKP